MAHAERALLLSCEHGGNRVPARYAALFAAKRKLLASHRGFDPGALAVARRLARGLASPLVAATTTRLLVDLNRSPHNPAVFSEVTRPLAAGLRQELLDGYHRPHWERVRNAIEARGAPVLHVAVHSFTPVWKGAPRRVAIGLLYDPRRRSERTLAVAWQQRLRERLPGLPVRRNAPYRGDADGLTTSLRRALPDGRYAGLELELSQALVSSPHDRAEIAAALRDTLRDVLSPRLTRP